MYDKKDKKNGNYDIRSSNAIYKLLFRKFSCRKQTSNRDRKSDKRFN